jgi:hypothetical protein
VIAGFVWVFGPGWTEGYLPVFPDSSSYLGAASAGPLSAELWFGDRPPTYPLLIWIVGPSSRAIVVAQTAIAVAAWAWLAVTVWDELRTRWLAVVTLSVLALVAIQTRWAFWHGAILTESLSGSLAVAATATWWRWFSRPDRFRLALAVALTGAWMLLRDSNAVTFVVVAFPALVLLAVLARRRTGPRRRDMSIALAALVAVGAFSLAGQFVSNRGETSFHNNVGLRWLVDDDMRAWMVARGMPESDALDERAGKDAWADGEAFLRSPFLAEYRDWAEGNGRVVAAWSFVVRADWYLDRFWRDLPAHTGTDHLAYDTFDLADRLPERPLGPVDPVGSRPAVVLWSLAVVASAVIVAVRRPRLGWLIPFWAAPIAADFYLVYVADAIEVGRHLVGPMLRYAVVAVLSVALAIDALLRPGQDDVAADVRDDGVRDRVRDEVGDDVRDEDGEAADVAG